MESFFIRQYRHTDIDQCRNLWIELTEYHRTIYDDPSIGGNEPGLYFDSHLARIGHESIWVVEYNNEVIGLAGLIVKDNEGEIDPLIVSAKHRGKGIGKDLVAFMIEEARKINLHYLNVKPVARNVDAINFYYNVGFRAIGQIELFIDLQKSEKWLDGIQLYGRSYQY